MVGTTVAADFEMSVPATRSALLACVERIGHFGAAGNLDRDVVARVRIIVEELFLNTIKYGYGGECERPVRLRITWETGVTLVYEDDAPPFDPTGWMANDDRAAAVAGLREGQAGIALLFGLASTVAYERHRSGNRLVVTLQPR